MLKFYSKILIILLIVIAGCVTTNSSQINSKNTNQSAIKVETPEDVVNKWLTYAKDQNWDAMATISQLTWKSKKGSSAAEEISWNYDFFDIKSWRIISSIKKSDTFYTVKVEIETQLGKKTMKANVIREISPYQESVNGKWGINPISAMLR